MDNKQFEIEIKKVEKPNLKEQSLKGGLALIELIPVIGGTLSSVISELTPNYKQKRLYALIKKLSEEIEQIKNNLNEEYITTEEFSYYFEKSVKKCIEEYNEEKIKYYTGFIVGNLNKQMKQTNNEKEFYLKIIETLTPLQLKMMRFMKNPQKYFVEINIDKSNSNQASLSAMFDLAFQGVDKQILRKSFGELFRLGLVNSDENSLGNLMVSKGFEVVITTLSDLGKNFIIFCEDHK